MQSSQNHQGRGDLLAGAEAERVLDILKEDATRNYDHYIEKQLTPIADTILNAIGSSMEAVAGQQQDLF